MSHPNSQMGGIEWELTFRPCYVVSIRLSVCFEGWILFCFEGVPPLHHAPARRPSKQCKCHYVPGLLLLIFSKKVPKMPYMSYICHLL